MYVCILCSHAHKAAVTSVRWNQNGNWLLTASRDHLIKLYDIRTMKEMEVLKGHKLDVNSEYIPFICPALISCNSYVPCCGKIWRGKILCFFQENIFGCFLCLFACPLKPLAGGFKTAISCESFLSRFPDIGCTNQTNNYMD